MNTISKMLDKFLANEIGWLITGVFVLLIIASSIAGIIKWRWQQKQTPNADGTVTTNPTLNNLVQRINAWWVMAFILVLTYWSGRIGALILYFLISFMVLREFLSIVYSRRSDHTVLVLCFYVMLPAQYFLVMSQAYGMYSIFIPVYGFIMLSIIAGLAGDTKHYLERTAKIQWALMVSVYFISHVPALLDLNIEGFEGKNVLLIFFLVIIAQASDVLQYIWGKLIGKHKIAPELSPNKTVEGFLGGVICASLLAILLSWMTPFGWWQAGLIGLMICLLGFVGGLVMSAIKRDSGVKDWGTLIKGHGGMLDRVDSICFAAPIFFHVVRYFWQN